MSCGGVAGGKGEGSKGWSDRQFSCSRRKKKVQWYSAWRRRAEVRRKMSNAKEPGLQPK